ncbi:ubiquinol oxidase 4, chloroplastic/chromoplastic [Andrographis paniculata]|uniref:ubiquinol oxidase 4, chloroplastic/chromoplastic n=1 Tax=Andrographis paniculata TaxID=175694 RepID=UPI0021E83C82|nr:ubiquinol oxidase 4, chloroplastic/chromoplastic [Andrographis paniculata]
MAISAASSMVSGISIPSSFLLKPKEFPFSPLASVKAFHRCYHASLCSYRSASRQRFSRGSFRVQATTLQEDEEKVAVEKSFDPKSFPEKEGTSAQSPDGSPPSSDLEKSIIKLEQSINIFLTDSVIKILDSFYQDRNYARFFVLETIARVPYFAFMSVLHLYETFGLWRRADYLKVHFAESWNEMHHLLIMEELGGDDWWLDRWLAQGVAFVYYFVTVFMYFLSPRMAYHFSECVESHAFETYDKFIKAQKDELKRLPAPEVAVKYYTGGDLYLFDEFQTSRPPNTRRPKIENLYDVFLNIRDDEAEHCKTMKACQVVGGIRSPHSLEEDSEYAGEGSAADPLDKSSN